MTGRGMGYCAGYAVPGYMNPGYGGVGYGGGMGYGRGMGRGGGRGRRNWFYATGMPGWGRAAVGLPAWGAPGPFPGAQLPADQELELLKQQSEDLKGSLDDIAKRIEELESAEEK